MKTSSDTVSDQAGAELKLAFKLPPDEFERLKKNLAEDDGQPNEALRKAFARYRATCESK